MLDAAPIHPPFEDIFATHYRRVYSLCLRMLRNEADAEDLTQSTFIQINRKLHLFRGDSKLTTWIHRITVNQVLMFMRRERTRPNVDSIDDDAIRELVLDSVPAPNDFSPVDRRDLQRAVDALTPSYRKTLLLHDWFGYEHEQIGRMLGVSEGTSKSQLHKARKKMQRLLNRKQNPKLYTGIIDANS